MKKLNIITALTVVLMLLMACNKNKDIKIIDPPCSFNYSAWSLCANNVQTRTYTSSPSGCIGTPPLDSIQRGCVIPCFFVYSSWSFCSSNIQTRTYTSSPSGCTGSPPADSIQRSCTPCVFVYSSWSFCSNNIQTRTYTSGPSGCTGTPPADSIQRPCVILSSVQIGSQTWTKENLDVATYRNGDPIPEVQNANTWANLSTGAWCYYANNTANGITYGKLYNWYAVNDPRGLAPNGYHIPTDAEWTTLITSQGGTVTAGNKLKEFGTSHWLSPNTGATNSSGFTGLPGGFRFENGNFASIGGIGDWWSSSAFNTTSAWGLFLSNNDGLVNRNPYDKHLGFSVRCLRD